jgi:hypothetical protein
VLVSMQDSVGMAMRVRMRVVGRVVAVPFGHAALFGPNVGKTR